MKDTSANDELASDLASLQIARGSESTPSRWRSLRWLGILLVVVAGAGGLFVAFRGKLETKAADIAVVLSIQPGQEAPLFVATGTVTAATTDTLAPLMPGRLMKRLVSEGDEVDARQPVAELDPTDLKLALNQSEADLASAEARVGTAKAAEKSAEVKAARAQELFKSNAGTEADAVDRGLDVDSARAELRAAVADVAQARARVETARKNLAEATLRAPFHGVVIKILAEPGDFVATSPGQGVMQIADLSSLEVDAEVSEASIRRVTQGMPVEVRLDALPREGLVGHVFAIRPNVDVAKATTIVKVRLDSEPPKGRFKLFPGMNGKVSFLDHEPNAQALGKPPSLEVPAAAVVHRDGEAEVLTVAKDGRVGAARIATAGTDGDRVVLREGPPAGTTIVANPAGIRPGDRIAPNK
jgi:HlyD family secretion protein